MRPWTPRRAIQMPRYVPESVSMRTATAKLLQVRATAPAQLEVCGILLIAGAAKDAAGLRSFGGECGNGCFCARAVPCMFQPNLRLCYLGWHVADNARRMFIEDVRGNPRLLQPMQQEIRVESVQGGIEAFH